MKIKKIDTSIPLNVVAQSCTKMCEEKDLAAKTTKEGHEGGCWTATGYTARGALF